jgi:hypothetical protein
MFIKAQQMAAHESPRTTKLYDQRNDVVSLDQVEKVVFELAPAYEGIGARCATRGGNRQLTARQRIFASARLGTAARNRVPLGRRA